MMTASITANDAVRKAAYFDAQHTLYRDAPWVFGYVLQNIEAQSTAVDGWAPAADNSESAYPVSLRSGDGLVIAMRTDSIGTFDPSRMWPRTWPSTSPIRCSLVLAINLLGDRMREILDPRQCPESEIPLIKSGRTSSELAGLQGLNYSTHFSTEDTSAASQNLVGRSGLGARWPYSCSLRCSRSWGRRSWP